MKKYWKIINTNTWEEMYVTAINMERVELFVLQNLTPDWFYGNNIIEVNEDKTAKKNGDFLCNAIRRYYVETFETNNDKEILNIAFEHALKRYKEAMAKG